MFTPAAGAHRKRLTSGEMVINHPYFAYGSNMWPGQMHDRCPDSAPREVARLVDHRFAINERGVATVLASPGADVLGVLWTVSSDHIRALDGFEGLATGNYVRELVRVRPARADEDGSAEVGPAVEAWMYIACQSGPGRPREGYLERVIDGAVHFELDESYVENSLRSWSAGAPEES